MNFNADRHDNNQGRWSRARVEDEMSKDIHDQGKVGHKVIGVL